MNPLCEVNTKDPALHPLIFSLPGIANGFWEGRTDREREMRGGLEMKKQRNQPTVDTI